MFGNENNRRSNGQSDDERDNRLPNGKPNLAPAAGYAGNEPVQYADETDEQFAMRVSDFETRRLHAEQIQAGGATLEQKKKEAKLRYEAELASIDAQEETSPSNGSEVNNLSDTNKDRN